MWDLVVGFIAATFLLPIVQQPHFSSRVRALITFVFCIVAGWITAWLNGAFDAFHGWADVRAAASSMLLVLVAAITSYKGFSQPTGIAPAIERATSTSV
jgi:hypothetical protein